MARRARDAAEREARALRDFDPALRLDELLLLAPLLLAERLLPDFAAEDFERDAVERFFAAPPLRALLARELPERPELLPRDPLELELAEAVPSIDHLPLITRCAASATASAISDPNLVALDSTDFAALSAVSAASIPASRIALRAFGLALIAAAAAARPAASISLLIAALASFSVVLLDELGDFDRVLDDCARVPANLDPVLLLDLAIANLHSIARLDTQAW